MVSRAKVTKRVRKADRSITTAPLGLAAAADLIGKSETHILNLHKSGLLPKIARGQYRARDVARAALKFREAEDRRTSQTEETKRLQAAKARRIELQNGQVANELIPIGLVREAATETVGAFVSELRGLPAACTRDLAFRDVIEEHLNGAFERIRNRLNKMGDDLAAGRDPLADDGEG